MPLKNLSADHEKRQKVYPEIPSRLSAPNYKADLRQGAAVEYVSCEPTESARELFDGEYEPVEEEQKNRSRRKPAPGTSLFSKSMKKWLQKAEV